jgi:hypothetical protein
MQLVSSNWRVPVGIVVTFQPYVEHKLLKFGCRCLPQRISKLFPLSVVDPDARSPIACHALAHKEVFEYGHGEDLVGTFSRIDTPQIVGDSQLA